MRRLRIGIDGSLACSERPTGVEYFAKSLLREIVQLGAGEVEWTVYLPPYGKPGCDFPDGVRVQHRPDVNTLIKTPWLVGRTWLDRLDAVYAFGHRLPGGCCGKYVLTVHDTAFDAFPECYGPGDAERAHKEVDAACRQAARVVVPSQATRQNLIQDYGCDEGRIDVLLEAGRPEFTPGAPGPLPEKVTAAGITAPFVLSVGRLDRRKNAALVIDAYRQVLASGVPCGGLVVVGPDASGSADVAERLAAGCVPGERIVTTGYVSEEELISLYRAAAVFVYPSRAEGFGLPVLEAMASGLPTITSTVSSMPEVAGDAALLVDPTSANEIAEALGRVLANPGERERLAAAGLARASEFTWEASAKRLYASLLRTVRA